MGSGKILTIEIGEKNIKVCEIGYSRPVVYRTASFVTPEGTMYDGYIVSIDKLAEYLEIKLKENSLFRKDVIFSISSSRIMSREIQIPCVKDKLLRKVALARADEYFTGKLEEYVISTLLLSKNKKADRMRINLFAAPRDLVVGYFSLASKLGIRVESVDYAGNALHQWLSRNLKKETAIVVNIGYYITVASIMDEGRMRMQHNISAGLTKLTRDNNEKVKESPFGIAKPWELLEEQSEEVDSAEIAEADLEILIVNLTKMLDYYNSNNMGKPIEKVYIIGEGTHVCGLEEKIKNRIKAPVVIMEKAFGIMLGRRGSNIEKGNVESSYITCMGAEISPAGLVPYEVRLARERKTKFEIFRNYTFKSTIFLLFVLALFRINFIEAQNQNAGLNAEIKQKSYAAGVYEKYTKNKKEYDYLYKLDKDTEIYKDNLLTFLIEVENKLPKGTDIIEFSSNDEGVSLSVSTPDNESAAKFIMRLREVEYVKDVFVFEIKYDKKRKMYIMNMRCIYDEHRENLNYE